MAQHGANAGPWSGVCADHRRDQVHETGAAAFVQIFFILLHVADAMMLLLAVGVTSPRQYVVEKTAQGKHVYRKRLGFNYSIQFIIEIQLVSIQCLNKEVINNMYQSFIMLL